MPVYLQNISMEDELTVDKRIGIHGAYHILPITDHSEAQIRLNGAAVLVSTILSRMLSDCREAVIIGVTLQDADSVLEDMPLSQRIFAEQKMERCVNSAVEKVREAAALSCRKRGGIILPKRLCAGFGDFPLYYQKVFFELLGMENLGAKINESYMLTPQKSVITITGVTYGD